MKTKHCVSCGSPFEAATPRHKYCGTICQQRHGRYVRSRVKFGEGRYCRQCGVAFCPVSQRAGNQHHCSLECSKQSARESRSKFYARNPEKDAEYRARTKERGKQGGNLERLRARYPDLPTACESCGEARVLDIAHKPEHRRNGAWRSKANTTRDKVWILCPTCHALIDRMGFDPATLGLA